MNIDIHGHSLDLAYRNRLPLNAPLGGNTDIPMMRRGGVTAQLCATWTPDIRLSGPHSHSVEEPLRALLGLLDYLHRELRGPAGDEVRLAQSGAELRAAEASGQVALIVGMEGTDALGGDPAILRILHQLGLRHVGLVHEHANEFGAASQVWEGGQMLRYDPARHPPRHLSEAGRELIVEMKRLGILIDLTHLVEPAFSEAIDFIAGPVIIGHAGARGLTDSTRYLSDPQIRAVARAGGVLGASPSVLGPSSERHGLPLLLDTIDYFVRLVGPDYVGVGTDFKDIPGLYPPGFANSGETPGLLHALRNRGYSPADIDRIGGGNFLRVFEQVVG